MASTTKIMKARIKLNNGPAKIAIARCGSVFELN
jgi:hypothetical protein